MDVEKRVVLLVDDSRTIRAVIGEQLRAAGYEPLFAATGEEALAFLEHESPSAILLDINLPDIDGYSVCRRIKARPAHLPHPRDRAHVDERHGVRTRGDRRRRRRLHHEAAAAPRAGRAAADAHQARAAGALLATRSRACRATS